MTKFVCKRCSYRFEREMEKPQRLCPNCGEENAITKEKSAKELIDEID